MLTFVFILVFIFFIWPLIRVVLTMNRVRKQARQAYEQMYNQNYGGARAHQQRTRKPGWNASATPRRKKIDPSVGDYVPFEEVSEVPTDRTHSSGRASFTTEQQITDAEWEEIK